MPNTAKRRVVLYSAEDYEPITAIEVPGWAVDKLLTGDHVRFPVPEPLEWLADPSEAAVHRPLRTVTVRALRALPGPLILLTDDDSDALRLDAEMLPGQRATHREAVAKAYRHGFVDGLLKALSP